MLNRLPRWDYASALAHARSDGDFAAPAESEMTEMSEKLTASLTATKLPQITLVFWIMKIAATTLGETGGDMLAQTLNVGYFVSTLILISVFLVSLIIQLRARKFMPALYWTVIVSTSTAGTTISDYMDRSLKLGYAKGTLILVSLLVSALVFWKVKFGSISIAMVSGFELELMYWTTILCSNTLGTALGDYLSDSSGLGFGTYGASAVLLGILVFCVMRTSRRPSALPAPALATGFGPDGDTDGDEDVRFLEPTTV